MEQLIASLGPLLYIDANIVVYAVEGYPAYEPVVRAILRAMDNRELTVVTSELTLAEVLVKPKQDGNATVQQAYCQFLEPSPAMRLVPVSQAILVSAAEIRATTALKLPDAIHVASARSLGCSAFLTNDQVLSRVATPPVKIMSEFL